jgi:hypothetical protein
MTSTALLNKVSELSENLGEFDSDILETRQMLRAFTGEAGPDELYALPPDFDYDAATARLTELLKERHKTSAALKDANEKYTSAKEAEQSKLLADLERKYKTAIVQMLKAAIDFAKCVQVAADLRDEARFATSRNIGPLPFVGPRLEGWETRERGGSSFIAEWVKDAISNGMVTGREEFLKDVAF